VTRPTNNPDGAPRKGTAISERRRELLMKPHKINLQTVEFQWLRLFVDRKTQVTLPLIDIIVYRRLYLFVCDQLSINPETGAEVLLHPSNDRLINTMLDRAEGPIIDQELLQSLGAAGNAAGNTLNAGTLVVHLDTPPEAKGILERSQSRMLEDGEIPIEKNVTPKE